MVMDDASIMNLLTTAPPMAAFASYLFYQNLGNVKRFDALMEKQDVREGALRDRYDRVISDLQSEKSELKDEHHNGLQTLSSKFEAMDRQIQDVEKKMDRLLISLDQITSSLQDLKMKDIARQTSKGS